MVDRLTKITDFIEQSAIETQYPHADSLEPIILAKEIKIQVTNSFAIQFSYLAQLLQYALQNFEKSKIPRSELIAHLGLTERHTEAVCSVATAFDLINPRKLTITNIGKTVAEGDPFLEYIGTLWILHYNVASNKKWLLWNSLMNEIFPNRQKITSEEARESFSNLRERLSKFSMNKKIRREIAIILDCYTKRAFNKLSIIQKVDSSYVFRKTDQLPPEILAANILIFRQRYNPNASGVSMETLIKGSNSPGRILNMEESTFRKILDHANHKGFLFIERKADLDQVRFREGITVETLLKTYYDGVKK